MHEEVYFSIAPGTFTALTGMNDHRAYFILNGDLNQMGLMERFLRERGFAVVKSNVYPGFPKDKENEFKRALQMIWECRVEGWWNQHSKLKQYEICTEEQFNSALDIECGKSRRKQ